MKYIYTSGQETLIYTTVKMPLNQWRSQGGAHWGTGPTNLVLCPTKLFLVRIKNSYVAILLHYISKELATF